VLEAGETIPAAARVWTSPLEGPVTLDRALAGDGHALVCFYPFDWSPTCTNELRLLHDRRAALDAAGVRPFGVSLDSAWSQRAFAETLGVAASVTMLSDRLAEAAAGFGVLHEVDGLPQALRSAFLVHDGTVRAAWRLGRDLPDVDAVVAAAR
jgi:peroxiredoxin